MVPRNRRRRDTKKSGDEGMGCEMRAGIQYTPHAFHLVATFAFQGICSWLAGPDCLTRYRWNAVSVLEYCSWHTYDTSADCGIRFHPCNRACGYCRPVLGTYHSLCCNLQFSGGTIVNRTVCTHKNLPGTDFPVFTNNIWSYLPWSPVIVSPPRRDCS